MIPTSSPSTPVRPPPLPTLLQPADLLPKSYPGPPHFPSAPPHPTSTSFAPLNAVRPRRPPASASPFRPPSGSGASAGRGSVRRCACLSVCDLLCARRGAVPPVPRRHGGEVRQGVRRPPPARPRARHPRRQPLPRRQGPWPLNLPPRFYAPIVLSPARAAAIVGVGVTKVQDKLAQGACAEVRASLPAGFVTRTRIGAQP